MRPMPGIRTATNKHDGGYGTSASRIPPTHASRRGDDRRRVGLGADRTMIRLARRASLIVVLLIVLVGAASAQSGWGLWQRTGSSSRRLGAFNTEAECRTAARRGAQSLYDMQSHRNEVHPGTVELHGTEVHLPAGSRSWVISFECFADTIDSSGPRK